MDRNKVPVQDDYRDISYWLSRTSSVDELGAKLKPYGKYQALLQSTIVRVAELRDADETGSTHHFFEQCKRLEAKTGNLQRDLRKSLDLTDGAGLEKGKEMLLRLDLILLTLCKENI